MPPSRPGRPAAAAAALLAAAALAARPSAAAAQLYGLPAVQSPFPGRPFAVAVDGGGGTDEVRVGGIAIAARRPGGRFLATLGAGRARGFEAARTTYGGRLAFALRFGESGAIAAAPFAGYGRVASGDNERLAAAPEPRLLGSLAIAPVGVGLGYRMMLAGRPLALHVTPQAQYWRRGAVDTRAGSSTWYGRGAVGADLAVTRQIGVSVAYEAGGSTADVTAGPRARLFGLALSYAPGRGGGTPR